MATSFPDGAKVLIDFQPRQSFFAYKNTRAVISAVIQKIMCESNFKGQHFNEHVWCEKW